MGLLAETLLPSTAKYTVLLCIAQQTEYARGRAPTPFGPRSMLGLAGLCSIYPRKQQTYQYTKSTTV